MSIEEALTSLIGQLREELLICYKEKHVVLPERKACATFRSFFMRHECNTVRIREYYRLTQQFIFPTFIQQFERPEAVLLVNRWITDAAIDYFIRTVSLVEFECKKEITIRPELGSVYKTFPLDDDFALFINRSRMEKPWKKQFNRLRDIRNWGVHNNFVAKRENFEITIQGKTFVFNKNSKPEDQKLGDNLLFAFETRRLYHDWLKTQKCEPWNSPGFEPSSEELQKLFAERDQ